MDAILTVENLPLLFESPANLYRGVEGVGGKLMLTREYLLFKPHFMNIQKEEEIIYLKEIEEVKKVNTLGIIPNALKVVTKQTEYKFVVKKRNRWIDEINKQIEMTSLT